MHREELKLSILQAQMARPRYTKEQVVSWISRFKYGNVDDPQYQRQIIDTFINSIYVFDDKLVFTYNFKDGTETITLAEIQAAFGSDLTQVAPPSWSANFDDTASNAVSSRLSGLFQLGNFAKQQKQPHRPKGAEHDDNKNPGKNIGKRFFI